MDLEYTEEDKKHDDKLLKALGLMRARSRLNFEEKLPVHSNLINLFNLDQNAKMNGNELITLIKKYADDNNLSVTHDETRTIKRGKSKGKTYNCKYKIINPDIRLKQALMMEDNETISNRNFLGDYNRILGRLRLDQNARGQIVLKNYMDKIMNEIMEQDKRMR